MIRYLIGWLNVIMVRLGLWKSPSLSVAGENPKNFKAIVDSDGGVWWIRAVKLATWELDYCRMKTPQINVSQE